MVRKKKNQWRNSLICSENQSTPKNGHFDVSNTLNGPWLKVKDFTCLLTRKKMNIMGK